jgi:hypothetical protein
VWQNGIAKSFNGRIRDELLNVEISRTIFMQALAARLGETNTITNGRAAPTEFPRGGRVIYASTCVTYVTGMYRPTFGH